MKALIPLMLVAVSAPALAQTGPYKLVITWYQSSLTVIDYPSATRCEAARRAVIEEAKRRSDQADADAPAGSIKVGRSPNGAFCIPG